MQYNAGKTTESAINYLVTKFAAKTNSAMSQVHVFVSSKFGDFLNENESHFYPTSPLSSH